jgi:hypothetical protein
VYSSTASLTSLLVGAGWSAPRPGRFTPGKRRGTHCQEAGWAPGPVWTVAEEILPFLGGRCFMDLVGLLGYLFVCLFVR